jgi:L-fucose isomerase-like protein
LRILRAVGRPLAVLAIPGIRAGSLVGAHQLGALLTELGLERALFYGQVGARATYAPLMAYARAAAARRRLERGKLAFVGRRTPGMTPIAFDEVEITRRFGPQVLSFGWEEVSEAVRKLAAEEVDAETARLRERVGSVQSSAEALRESVALYLALKSMADSEGILAFGLGCYPHLAGVVCLSAALLTEKALPAACEGDLNSGLAMYLAQSFSGQPAHFGEILDIDERENCLVSSHCGCAPASLAASRSQIALCPVRIWQRGVSIRFPPKASERATYVNLLGRRYSYRLCAVPGAALESEMVFEGNPVRFRPDCSWKSLLRLIDDHGFGHHWMLAYGDIAAELEAFCRLAGIRGVFPGAGQDGAAQRS